MIQWQEFTRKRITKRFFLISTIIIFTSLILQGCNMPMPAAPPAPPDDSYTITPMLREFYSDLNGGRYLGPAISTDFEVEGSTCQYTTNVLLCMNPVETDPNKRFFLASLGRKMGITEPPNPSIEPNSPFVINGYHIYPAFMAVYDDLRGDIHIGPPLTNVKYNQEAGRIEQYFQNAGFYIRLDDPDARVELLPYGRYICKTCTGAKQQQPTLAVPRSTTEPSIAFSNSLDRLGGTEIFGKPLSQPYTAPDGNLEQVYEKVAVYATQEHPDIIHFRPLAVILGMHSEAPRPQQFSRPDNMIFYPTQGELGYHVPVMFDSYILMHGGTDYSGQPISDPIWDMQDNEKVARQCFANYCLDYYPNAPAAANIRLAPLGSRYLQQQGSAPAPGTVIPQAVAPALQLLVSELLPQPTSHDNQVLTVVVFQQANSQPAPNIEVIATLTTPTGTQHSFYSAPTNEAGTTTMVIPPLPGIKHGDMITYQVCLAATAGQPACQFESYLIWDLN
jgi:hypothetical protein